MAKTFDNENANDNIIFRMEKPGEKKYDDGGDEGGGERGMNASYYFLGLEWANCSCTSFLFNVYFVSTSLF